MTRRRLAALVALILVVVVVVSVAGDWVGQMTHVIALATPTPNYVGNDLSPDVLVADDTVSYYVHGFAGRAPSFSPPFFQR